MQMSDETDDVLLSNGKTLIALHARRVGLVSDASKEHQKDSPDCVLVGTIDGEILSAVVEMKARCSSIAAAKERRRLNSERQCSRISCYSDDLRKHALKKIRSSSGEHLC